MAKAIQDFRCGYAIVIEKYRSNAPHHTGMLDVSRRNFELAREANPHSW